MRTPRVTDFDPNAKPPDLNSSMDHFPVIQKPQMLNQHKTRTPETPHTRIPERPNVKRIITRNSYEIYEDQVGALRDFAVEELKQTGKMGSMSAMVREAIDTYIKKRADGK